MQMSGTLGSAAKGTKNDKKEKAKETDSDDSETLSIEIENMKRIFGAKRALQEKQKEEESIQKQLDELTATNAHKMKELADKRNEYQV